MTSMFRYEILAAGVCQFPTMLCIISGVNQVQDDCSEQSLTSGKSGHSAKFLVSSVVRKVQSLGKTKLSSHRTSSLHRRDSEESLEHSSELHPHTTSGVCSLGTETSTELRGERLARHSLPLPTASTTKPLLSPRPKARPPSSHKQTLKRVPSAKNVSRGWRIWFVHFYNNNIEFRWQ